MTLFELEKIAAKRTPTQEDLLNALRKYLNG